MKFKYWCRECQQGNHHDCKDEHKCCVRHDSDDLQLQMLEWMEDQGY